MQSRHTKTIRNVLVIQEFYQRLEDKIVWFINIYIRNTIQKRGYQSSVIRMEIGSSCPTAPNADEFQVTFFSNGVSKSAPLCARHVFPSTRFPLQIFIEVISLIIIINKSGEQHRADIKIISKLYPKLMPIQAQKKK